MDLELHQLDLRYEELRRCHPARERQLVASLAEVGQQMPIVVVAANARFIVIDGYKRVRALRRLSRDTVRGTSWAVEEAEALVLERLMRGTGEDALEEGWLLAELQQRFGLSCEELARRFDRSKSWVSRRLGLIQELPGEIQRQVRAGQIAAHAAMKYLVPLARANSAAAIALATVVAPLKPTTRQVEQLYAGWQSGTARTRELIVTSPQVYLRAQQVQQAVAKSPVQMLVEDLGALAGICRRARKRLESGLLQQLVQGERDEVSQVLGRARADVAGLFTRFDLEAGHAG
jgi:ParB/RepB/Spo0J family partition protein